MKDKLSSFLINYSVIFDMEKLLSESDKQNQKNDRFKHFIWWYKIQKMFLILVFDNACNIGLSE